MDVSYRKNLDASDAKKSSHCASKYYLENVAYIPCEAV